MADEEVNNQQQELLQSQQQQQDDIEEEEIQDNQGNTIKAKVRSRHFRKSTKRDSDPSVSSPTSRRPLPEIPKEDDISSSSSLSLSSLSTESLSSSNNLSIRLSQPPTRPKISQTSSSNSISSRESKRTTSYSSSDFAIETFSFSDFPKDSRSKVVMEVFQTELSYLRHLETALMVFFKPLKERPDLISENELMNIFSNMESIFEFNYAFYEKLGERLLTWTTEKFDINIIGDLFLELLLKLPMYTVYCNNFDDAINVISRLEKKKKEFKDFMDECHQNPRCNSMKLPAFLLTPVQRIPRYTLLLKEIVEKTPPQHIDQNSCVEAYESLKSLADYVNESLMESESRKKMNDLKKSISGLRNLESPNRSLLKEGPLALITPKKKFQGLLFNDLLVFATKSETKPSTIILVLQLDSLWFEDLEDLDPQTTTEDAIEIYTPERPYTIYTKSNSEKRLWITALKKAIANRINSKEDNITIRKSIAFEYKDGSVYHGDWNDARRDGVGKFKWPSKTSYEGEWKEDEMYGNGTMIFSTGEKYKGDWSENKPNGFGVLTLVDQNVYEGEWLKGRKYGKGKLIHSNGDVFEGNFENDQIVGFGKLVCVNGSIYEGQWQNSKWNGKGKLIFQGSIYEGEFVNNNREGFGEMVYADGSKYSGDWKEDKRHGKGTYTTVTGESYEGGWFNDQKEGFGIMNYPNKDHYEGGFIRGMRNGQGKCTFGDTSFYEGEWENDFMQGKGVYIAPNKDKYDGQFVLNQREGYGVLVFHDGTTYDGYWKNGRKEGKGTLKTADGTSYQGSFLNDKRHGFGEWRGVGNNYYKGEWAYDRKDGKGMLATETGKYEGAFKSDMRHGQGVLTTLVGTRYEGSWHLDQKVKKGVLTHINGNTEVLTWEANTLISHGFEAHAPEIPIIPRPGFTT